MPEKKESSEFKLTEKQKAEAQKLTSVVSQTQNFAFQLGTFYKTLIKSSGEDTRIDPASATILTNSYMHLIFALAEKKKLL